MSVTSFHAANGKNGDIQLMYLVEGQPRVWVQVQSFKDGKWTPGGQISAYPYSKLVSVYANGQLHVVGLGLEDARPYYFYQDDSGVWHDMGPIPNAGDLRFTDVALGKVPEETLQLILIRGDNAALQWMRRHVNGQWELGPSTIPGPTGATFTNVYAKNGFSGNGYGGLQVISVANNLTTASNLVGAHLKNADEWVQIALPTARIRPQYAANATFGYGNGHNLHFIYINEFSTPAYIWQSANDGGWANGSFPALKLGFFPSAVVASSENLNQSGPLKGLVVFFIGEGNAYWITQDGDGNWYPGGLFVNIDGDLVTAATAAPGNDFNVQALFKTQYGAVMLYYADGGHFARYPGYLII